MALRFSDSFERVFPLRALFLGHSRAALIWSFFNALLLVLVFVDVFLLIDLLDHQGAVNLRTPENVVEYMLLVHGQAPASVRAELSQTDQGVRPTVWYWRDHWWAPTLAACTRRFPVLTTNVAALITLVLTGVGLGLFYTWINIHIRRLALLESLEVATWLRRQIHRQALRIGPSDLEQQTDALTLKLFHDEVDRVRGGVERWVDGLSRHPLTVLAMACVALSLDWLLTLQCAIPLAALWYLIRRQRLRAEMQAQRAQNRIAAQLRLLAESLRKTRLVRAFEMEAYEHKRFQQHLDRLHRQQMQLAQLEHWSEWVVRLLGALCLMIVFILAGMKVLVDVHGVQPFRLSGALVMIAAFAFTRVPLRELWELQFVRREAARSARHIFEFLDRVPPVAQAVGAKFLEPLSRELRFENVHYVADHGRRLLAGVDLALPARQSAAFLSLEPLEARALAFLIPRFIEPTEGRVLIDGHDIAWATLESLRAEVIFVGGNDPFFTGTVRENIAAGAEQFSLQEIMDAAKAAHAHKFITQLPQGYETVLGEHGEQLEPGQAFRLGLARAILRDPAVLIIEEPAADLDAETKALLDDTYQRLMRNSTVFFLPQRLSTLKRVDRIVLLYHGRVEAVGSHAELVRECELYRHLEYTRYNVFRHETS